MIFQLPLSGSPLVPIPKPPDLRFFQLPLSGSPRLHEDDTRPVEVFQLPLSGSLDRGRRQSGRAVTKYTSFNSLSRDHGTVTSSVKVMASDTFQLPLSGSQRMRGRGYAHEHGVLPFQLPLSGSPRLPWLRQNSPLQLSTPSLGITAQRTSASPPHPCSFQLPLSGSLDRGRRQSGRAVTKYTSFNSLSRDH